MSRPFDLLETHSSDAAITWGLVALVAAAAAVRLVAGDLLWTVYGTAVVAVALFPPVLARDASVLVAWHPLAIATVPVVVRGLGVVGESLSYLSVAALALLVVVEIHAFSAAEMPPWFAGLFVVLTTLAVAGLWGVAQYASDVALGTSFLADRQELMWDLVAATAVGVGAGVAFELAFRDSDRLAVAVDGVRDR